MLPKTIAAVELHGFAAKVAYFKKSPRGLSAKGHHLTPEKLHALQTLDREDTTTRLM